jgi:polyferredoxin
VFGTDVIGVYRQSRLPGHHGTAMVASVTATCFGVCSSRWCVYACTLGLVGGEGFAINASVIEADASRNRKAPGKPAAWPEDEAVTRPVQEYLDALRGSRCWRETRACGAR